VLSLKAICTETQHQDQLLWTCGMSLLSPDLNHVPLLAVVFSCVFTCRGKWYLPSCTNQIYFLWLFEYFVLCFVHGSIDHKTVVWIIIMLLACSITSSRG
jgi:hypothetical protein